MVSSRTFLMGLCLLFGLQLQVNSEDLALSTILYNNLREIFQNLTDVNWRALKSLYNRSADYLGFGLDVAGKVSKSAGTTADYASRGIGHTKSLTTRGVAYIGSGLQRGVSYLSKWLNYLSSIFQNYSQKLYSKNESSRRRRR